MARRCHLGVNANGFCVDETGLSKGSQLGQVHMAGIIAIVAGHIPWQHATTPAHKLLSGEVFPDVADRHVAAMARKVQPCLFVHPKLRTMLGMHQAFPLVASFGSHICRWLFKQAGGVPKLPDSQDDTH